jgi:hypothetical protein
LNVIVYAIPVFVALMAAEFGISLALGRNVYRLNDAIGSLTAGILSQISGVFMLALSVGVYVLVYDNLSLFSLSPGDWRVWVGALIAYDFFYYWTGTTASTTKSESSGPRMSFITRAKPSIFRPRSGSRARACCSGGSSICRWRSQACLRWCSLRSA